MSISLEEVEQFLYREARYLDDREFEKWLECYAPDAEYLDAGLGRRRHAGHRPAARDLADLVSEPRRTGGPRIPDQDRPVERDEPSRAADRPQHHQRRDHRADTATRVEIRFNWFTLYYRYHTVDTYFGTSFYTLDISGQQPLIKYKKVILKNDYIHHVVDIYHV